MIIYPDNPWPMIALFAFAPVCLLTIALLRHFGVFQPRCPECRSIAIKRDELRQAPAPDRDGIGVKIWECPECHWRREKEYRIIRPASYYQSSDPKFVPGGLERRYIVGSNLPGFSDSAGDEGAAVIIGRTRGGMWIISGLLLFVLLIDYIGWGALVAMPIIAYGVLLVAGVRLPVSTDDSQWQNWRPWFNPYGRAGKNGAADELPRGQKPPRGRDPR